MLFLAILSFRPFNFKKHFFGFATGLSSYKFYMELGLIPHRLRVYVWARDPQQIVNTAAIAEQTLRRRIENSIAR
jgi:hypothetical protein